MDTILMMRLLRYMYNSPAPIRAIDTAFPIYGYHRPIYREIVGIYHDMNYLSMIGLIYPLSCPDGVYWVLTSAGEMLALLSRPRPQSVDTSNWPRGNGNVGDWVKLENCRFKMAS